MSQWKNTDTQVPTFSKERVVRPVVRLTANAVSDVSTTNTTIFFAATTGVTAGMYVYGNNVYVNSYVPGFLSGNCTVTAVNSSNVVISNKITANVNIGDTFLFSNTISYATELDQTYDDNTVLVTNSRLANVAYSNTNSKPVAHTGWIQVKKGLGHVTGVAIANANSTLTYANAYVTFVGANTTSANGQLVVDNGANTPRFVLNSTGTGYEVTPTITATGANNASLIFTVSMGGRANRIQAETLVALSNSAAYTTTSGGTYFPGV